MALKRKLAEWSKRYLPAEVLSTAITLVSAWLVHQQGGGALTVALVSTWSGNISYFGYILTADILGSIRAHRIANKQFTATSAMVNLRSLVIEFGLAEAMDSLLIRPLIMYYVPLIIADFTSGILLAKLAADTVFYIPAIVGYELNKKYLKRSV